MVAAKTSVNNASNGTGIGIPDFIAPDITAKYSVRFICSSTMPVFSITFSAKSRISSEFMESVFNRVYAVI